MVLPGTLPKVKQLIEFFLENNIKYVLRRIHPVLHTDGDTKPWKPFEKKKIKEFGIIPIKQQMDLKHRFKDLNFQNTNDHYFDLYSSEELDWLEQTRSQNSYSNMGVWLPDGSYQETHSDEILNQNWHNYTGWICYAGVDLLTMEFDGSIYRGQCHQGDVIGHITDLDFKLPEQPTVCDRNTCYSALDITTRKSKSSHVNLIT
jgi:hypothetical protein